MPPARGPVLDANILIRLVLGRKVRELVLAHLDAVAFFAADECFNDARHYLPDLLHKRNIALTAAAIRLAAARVIQAVLDWMEAAWSTLEPVAI